MCRFLVPRMSSISKIRVMLSKALVINVDESLYLFVENKVINSSLPIQSYYEKHKDNDGFLYMSFSEHASFGKHQ